MEENDVQLSDIVHDLWSVVMNSIFASEISPCPFILIIHHILFLNPKEKIIQFH